MASIIGGKGETAPARTGAVGIRINATMTGNAIPIPKLVLEEGVNDPGKR